MWVFIQRVKLLSLGVGGLYLCYLAIESSVGLDFYCKQLSSLEWCVVSCVFMFVISCLVLIIEGCGNLEEEE